MTLHTALLQGTKLLEDAGVSAPRLTAEVLLAFATGHERQWLFAHSGEELKELWWIHYGRYLRERTQGKPTQQITGRQEFYGREFRVSADVLIPRPETEHVIEAVLSLASHWREPSTCDIGAGSGAIAVTLAIELNTRIVGTDISEPALCIAARNAKLHGAAVDLVQADLAAPFADGSFDLVVSNPPYVPSIDRAHLQAEVRDWEPDIALYGGEDGLDVYRRLIPDAHRVLKPGGWLVMEIGHTLRDAVLTMIDAWKSVEVRADLAGFPRVISARKAAG